VSIGLALGLNKIGKKAICALREPSLGPCFGMKGGAAGGGYAQVLPMEKINLHFTGDFHAITSAHNMIAALLDNYMYQNRDNGFAMKEVLWNRVLDVNDRTLRYIVTGLGGKTNGITRESGFDITPASEIMAILCLAKDEDDLRRRIENILLGFTIDNKPFTVKDLGVAGAITVLLKDALSPNLVQTTEHTAAFVHGGPFANIAHGCNSVLATKLAMTFSDYVITEAGFGADLGAEKFYDIKCRKAGLQPKLTLIVATAQGLKMHGGVSLDLIKEPNMEGLVEGVKNLDKHIENLRKFGQTVAVAFNRYANDSEEEIEFVRQHCAEMGVGFAVNNAFAEGGNGAIELANLVVDTIEKQPSQPLTFAYEEADSVEEKVTKIACGMYGAKQVIFGPAARKKLKMIEELGYTNFPICIAKTQYSFSTDATQYGVASGFNFAVRDIVINAGAEMLVIVAGEIMRMPGLPKVPQALHIDIVNGEIEGLS
ncbi:MAG: formate--tetrahydrofolate ligase, partial [Phocaeicola sp.]|nr:formate--tetrahydrofolate ligase [Phocaeicola sp.]